MAHSGLVHLAVSILNLGHALRLKKSAYLRFPDASLKNYTQELKHVGV